jgi:hypothetical protein
MEVYKPWRVPSAHTTNTARLCVCAHVHGFFVPPPLLCAEKEKEDASFVTVLLSAYLPNNPLFPKFALRVGHHDAVVLQYVHTIHVAVAIAPYDRSWGIRHYWEM